MKCLMNSCSYSFLLDYNRWGSFPITDMESLNSEAQSALSKRWVVQKTDHRFSTIPPDHVHPQENAKFKVKGSIIRLTKDPKGLNE